MYSLCTEIKPWGINNKLHSGNSSTNRMNILSLSYRYIKGVLNFFDKVLTPDELVITINHLLCFKTGLICHKLSGI